MSDLGYQFIDNIVSKKEGGYVNNPKDRGGETIWGVTVAVARENGYNGPMIQMPRSTGVDILYRRYYLKPKFDKVAALLPEVAKELLDTGINMGVDAGLPQKWLQRSLNLMNRQGVDYPDILVDGDIGSKTIAAIQGLIKKRGLAIAEDLLLKNLNGFQWEKYRDITEAGGPNSSQEEFFVGWVENRIGSL